MHCTKHLKKLFVLIAEKFAQIEAERLRKENEVLYTECQQLKKDLVRVETQLGRKYIDGLDLI